MRIFDRICHCPSVRSRQGAVNQPRDRCAFTLIELLVIIGVIVVLASLILPCLSKAKKNAQFTVCKSNLRQVGMALTMYVSDFSVYPPCFEVSIGAPMESWMQLIEPYASDIRIRSEALPYSDVTFLCPSDGNGYGYSKTGVEPLPYELDEWALHRQYSRTTIKIPADDN